MPTRAVAIARPKRGLKSSLMDCKIRKISNASGRDSAGATNARFSKRRASVASASLRSACNLLQPARLYSTIDALQLPLGNRDRALGVLAAGAVVRNHVDHQEVGDRGRRLLAGRADAGSGKRALAGLAEHLILRIRRPHRRGIIGVE